MIAMFQALGGLYGHYSSFRMLVSVGMVLAFLSVISALLMGLLFLRKGMRRKSIVHYLFAISFAFLVGVIFIYFCGEVSGFLLLKNTEAV